MQTASDLGQNLLQRAVVALLALVRRLPVGSLPRAGEVGPLMRSAVAAGWQEWFDQEPQVSTEAALADLARQAPQEVREQGAILLDALATPLEAPQREHLLAYLAALPVQLSRSLPQGRAPSRLGLASLAHGVDLQSLLPLDIPPHAAPCDLPGTPYRLDELVGSGGFGSVYRGTDARMPYLPLALKFCRDAGAIPSLRRERDNLERLLRSSAEDWSPRVVRLCGYDLDHPTPYLVYEWVAGGDLATVVLCQEGPPTADQVLAWMRGIVEGLAFAHARGLVHRDLKPGNVLVGPEGVKITDFGIGGLAQAETSAVTRSLLRGAGTPMYMAPEQRRGAAPDPRHDLYSLGVIWYQLLLGDLSAEIHPGWEADLRQTGRAPAEQIRWIGQCVGPLAERPADAGRLFAQLERPAVPATLLEQVRSLHSLHLEAAAVVPTWGGWFQSIFAGVMSWWATTALGLGVVIPLMERNRDFRDLFAMLIMVVAVLAMYLGYRTGRWFRSRAVTTRQAPIRRQLELQADLVRELFPQAVAAWGGRAALLDPEQAEQMLLRLQAETRLANADWRPASTARAAAARTEVPAQPNPELHEELFRQYREAVRLVRAAHAAPKWVKAVTSFIAVYSGMIALGLTIALPVVFIALYGNVSERSLWIPMISVAGLGISTGLSYTLSRWFYTSQRRRRLAEPTRALADRAALLERAFPDAVQACGGVDRLLNADTAAQTLADLETRITTQRS